MPAGTTPVRLAAALACVILAVFLTDQWRQERTLHRAGQALAAGRSAEATSLTQGLDHRSVRGRALRTAAAAALQRGDLVAAERELALAVAAAPNDWTVVLEHAVLLRRLGRREDAGRAFGVALALNPRLVPPEGFRR